MSTGLHPVCSQ